MVADGRTVDSEENKNLLRQYHFRTDIFVSSTSEEAVREKARAELDTEQGVKLVLEDVLDLPEYRKEDDELITLPLPRREVAAIILYHLEVADLVLLVSFRFWCRRPRDGAGIAGAPGSAWMKTAWPHYAVPSSVGGRSYPRPAVGFCSIPWSVSSSTPRMSISGDYVTYLQDAGGGIRRAACGQARNSRSVATTKTEE